MREREREKVRERQRERERERESERERKEERERERQRKEEREKERREREVGRENINKVTKQVRNNITLPQLLDLHIDGVMRLTVHIETNFCGGKTEGPENITLSLQSLYMSRVFDQNHNNNNNNNNHIPRRYSRFFTISSQRHELSPTRTLKWPRRSRVLITCNTSSAYHVQHVVLRAT